MGIEKIAVKVLDFYIGDQRRKLKYQEEEAAIHSEIKELAYSIEEKERKAELKRRRKKRGA